MSELLLDPNEIYFTFSRIRPKFSCGRTVQSTIDALMTSAIDINQLPRITVLFDGKHFFSLNNRRLYCFKALREAKRIETIPVRVRPVPDTKRMATKYSIDHCTLQARLMREGEKGNGGDEPSDEEDDDLHAAKLVDGDQVREVLEEKPQRLEATKGTKSGNNGGKKAVPAQPKSEESLFKSKVASLEDELELLRRDDSDNDSDGGKRAKGKRKGKGK